MARFEKIGDSIQELYVQTYTVGSVEPKELRVLRQPTPAQVAAGDWAVDDVALGFTGLVGTIPPAGVFLCGSEKIQYGSITWTSSAVGTLNNCKRGWEGTTAAAHTAGDELFLGDAFAYLNDATGIDANDETIAFDGLDRPGQLPETGVIFIGSGQASEGSEWVWYGGVTYTNNLKTAGNLLYCRRGYDGTTAQVHADNTLIRFEHIFKGREAVGIYNYAGDSTSEPLYYGFNPAIQNNGVNALALEHGADVTLRVGHQVRIYAILDGDEGSTTGTVAIAEWR
jgi:hypothetical protein